MSSFLSMFKRKTPKQIIQENQRLLSRSIRELDREKTKLGNTEKKYTLEIKKMAKINQVDACKTMAKEIVFLRQNITQMYATRSKLYGISMKLQAIRSTEMMASAMKGAAKSMGAMNRSVNIPEIQQMLMTFEKNSDMLEAKTEMVDDIFSDIVETEDADKETDRLAQSVLDEIGVELAGNVPSAPAEKEGGKDLMDRLSLLKKK
ncbi:MAG: ESCRT III complex subunit Did4 [Amphiamblys sp. WSBS2006]|nr:MAG: ESCRT III complex subunit Did4 [Amphiamblys sp. WSBS2006]